MVLACKNETQLREIAKKLSLSAISHICIQEIDPPWNGQMTAIGVVPLQDRQPVKKILSSLPLLGRVSKDTQLKANPKRHAQILSEDPVE